MVCKDCGAEAKYYDTVNRRVLYEGRKTVYISVERYRCTVCRKIHRVSDDVMPFKHYAKSFIFEAVENGISDDQIYPSEMTLYRWSQEFQCL